MNQRLGPVIEVDGVDALCLGLIDNLLEHVELHGFFEIEIFRVAHWARRAAQIARTDDIDVHIYAGEAP